MSNTGCLPRIATDLNLGILFINISINSSKRNHPTVLHDLNLQSQYKGSKTQQQLQLKLQRSRCNVLDGKITGHLYEDAVTHDRANNRCENRWKTGAYLVIHGFKKDTGVPRVSCCWVPFHLTNALWRSLVPAAAEQHYCCIMFSLNVSYSSPCPTTFSISVLFISDGSLGQTNTIKITSEGISWKTVKPSLCILISLCKWIGKPLAAGACSV